MTRAIYALIGATAVFGWIYWSAYGTAHAANDWADLSSAEWFHVLQFTLLSYFMARASKWKRASSAFCGAAVVSGAVLTPLLQMTDGLPELAQATLTYIVAVALVVLIPEDLKKSPTKFTIGVFWAFVGVYFVFAGFHAPAINDYVAALGSTTRTALLGASLLIGIGSLIWAAKTHRPWIWVLIAPAFGAAGVFVRGGFEPHSSSPHAWMDIAMAVCSLWIASGLRHDRSP